MSVLSFYYIYERFAQGYYLEFIKLIAMSTNTSLMPSMSTSGKRNPMMIISCMKRISRQII